MSSESISQGQKESFIYMVVNGIEIDDAEKDEYFSRFRFTPANQHMFSGLPMGLYRNRNGSLCLLSYTRGSIAPDKGNIVHEHIQEP